METSVVGKPQSVGEPQSAGQLQSADNPQSAVAAGSSDTAEHASDYDQATSVFLALVDAILDASDHQGSAGAGGPPSRRPRGPSAMGAATMPSSSPVGHERHECPVVAARR